MARFTLIPDAPAAPDTFESFAADMGLEIEARHVATRPDVKPGQWHKDSIHFLVTVTRPHDGPTLAHGARPPAGVWTGFYTVGSAWPLNWARDGANIKPRFDSRLPDNGRGGPSRRDESARRAYHQLQNKNAGTWGRLTLHDESLLQTIRAAFERAAPLKLSDVLQSLQCDSRDWESTFEDWASDMGMDTDSKSAESIFRACQDTAKTIRAAIGRDNFDRFLNIEES